MFFKQKSCLTCERNSELREFLEVHARWSSARLIVFWFFEIRGTQYTSSIREHNILVRRGANALKNGLFFYRKLYGGNKENRPGAAVIFELDDVSCLTM